MRITTGYIFQLLKKNLNYYAKGAVLITLKETDDEWVAYIAPGPTTDYQVYEAVVETEDEMSLVGQVRVLFDYNFATDYTI